MSYIKNETINLKGLDQEKRIKRYIFECMGVIVLFIGTILLGSIFFYAVIKGLFLLAILSGLTSVCLGFYNFNEVRKLKGEIK